jgi:hypothetical protein
MRPALPVPGMASPLFQQAPQAVPHLASHADRIEFTAAPHTGSLG